jgi:CheY-like chemotaxis protein
MSKIDAGAMELELREVTPNDFIDSAILIMIEQFRKKNIKLERFIDPTLTLVTVDVRRCKQIMLNLLSNAFKYTPSGGQVTVQAIKEENNFKVTVSDSGIGIEVQELDKIFLEFYQAKGPHQEVQLSGTGIGLALTRRLVELHGGEIRATSTLGQGSTFWFTIPLKNSSLHELIEQPQLIETVEKQKNGRRILIAEDNSTNLMMILEMLNVHGHQVIVARNRKEAIDLTELYKPELILMDMQMPIMDGLEATRRLREQLIEIPIIALTATTGADAIKQQLMAGCVEHLAKPIQSKELFNLLQRYLA